MKLKRARIQNFKGVKECEINFMQPKGDSPRRLIALTGDNGSGKTTVLQAIALTLSLATRRTRAPEQLRWHGFLAERLGTLGQTRVELEVALDPLEVARTTWLYERWTAQRDMTSAPVTAPSEHANVTLVYEGGKVTSPQGSAAYFQLFGRYYIKVQLSLNPKLRAHFTDVGDVFWFDQLRNLGSRTPEDERSEAVEGWSAGVEQLREDLVGWWGYHTSPNRDSARDFIAKLEPYFGLLFPGTRFVGIEPRTTTSSLRRSDFYFLFERDGRTYDLAELSSGEQAVFPLLTEFVRLDIARSIVLIDELELHLHPPEQQALLGALRKIGPDCQFIVTTHSPYLADAIPDEEIVRLKGGRPCL